MKHTMKVDPSVVITYKNEKILVSTLPEELKNEIFTLDRIKQDKIDALYNVEVMELAFQAKMLQLNQLLVKHFGDNNGNSKESLDPSK